MKFSTISSAEVLNIYLTLTEYPILCDRIRSRMRQEIFKGGVVTPQDFENEVRDSALRSQIREGIHYPISEEPADIWANRLDRVRDHLTDFYFAYNFPYERFDKIVREVLAESGQTDQNLLVTFNPELAPRDMIIEQAIAIEKMPPEKRGPLEHRLRENKVVLIRTMISDQLAYIKIAKEWFTTYDLVEIRKRKIGHGKIGGKAAGMLLAARILNEVSDTTVRESIRVPESYYLGSDLLYTFMAYNDLIHWNDQKYKSEDQIKSEYPQIVKEFEAGTFPPDIVFQLNTLLKDIGQKPIIVRSSSLLEDNFGTSFAGKYDSFFCPNQGTPEENLNDLIKAIARIYASTLNPNALLYRRSKGLQDYDERMAILFQLVEGEPYGEYFLPHAAGVAFSRNYYRWSPQIRREDGFARIVWGLGTRAVDRVGNDYPRLVALSHPTLHPESNPQAIRRYSQQYIDLIDLAHNSYKTLPLHDVLKQDYRPLKYIAQLDQDGSLTPIHIAAQIDDPKNLIITFDDLLRRTEFPNTLREILQILEASYHSPVDLEFSVNISTRDRNKPKITIAILQCRPQSQLLDTAMAPIPADLPTDDIIFSSQLMLMPGYIPKIDYVLFVTPEGYYALQTESLRAELSRSIGRLNSAMADKDFICVGPGRWGTYSPDLGVHIGYSDIYNTKALIELSGQGIGPAPEPSFGTHFFQDLVESHIYPLAIQFDKPDTIFNHAFFYETPNHISQIIKIDDALLSCLRLIEVDTYRKNHHMELVMDDEKGQALAYLIPNQR